MVSLSLLLEQYRAAAFQHGQATERGDARTANKQYEQVMRAYRGIKQHGEEAMMHLGPLLKDDDFSVASWAAAHLLPYDEQQATTVLQHICKQPGIVAFSAEMVLREWKNGRLRFD
ncbi:MAG: hypothetical protein M3Y54_18815 [Bacteroidota bacterium]|nr:hypothetical protein [Bacteroidota bacterium]